MKVVALVTQKGGTGKSSLVISLAVAAAEQGLKSYVLDLDPQATAKSWFERRTEDSPEVAAIEPVKILPALDMLRRQKFDLVFIDTAGVDTPATTTAMQAADLCLIPARPSIADIEASRPTVRTLAKLGRPYAFVLNQCPAGRSVRTSDAFRVLSLSGSVAGSAVALRTDHVDALAAGQGVTERDGAGKAASEIRELLGWLINRLEGKIHDEKARVA